MGERLNPDEQRYAQVLHRYMLALEQGDIETVAAILYEAEQDSALERVMLMANSAYQDEQGITISTHEVKQAQALLLDTFSSQQDEYRNVQESGKHPMQIQEAPRPQATKLLSYPPKRTRLHHLGVLAQTLVAVLVIGVLVSGFALLFASRHKTTVGSGNTHTTLSRSVVVTSTEDGTVYGIRPDTGSIVWHYATGKSVFGGSANDALAVYGEVVYYADNAQLYALHATNGTLLWHRDLAIAGSTDTQNSYTTIIVDHDIVFVSGRINGIGLPGGGMYALRKRDGATLWHYWCDTNSLLAVHNGVVYVQKSTSAERLEALRGSDGTLLWSYKTPVMAVVANDTAVYVYSAHPIEDMGRYKQNKTLFALNMKGTLLWSRPVVDDGVNSLLMTQGVLIVGEIDNKIYHVCAYRTTNGSQAWCTPNELAPGAVNTTSYTALDSTVYSSFPNSASGSGSIEFEAHNVNDGRLRWSILFLSNSASGKFIVMNKMVYELGYHDVKAIDNSNAHVHWWLLNRTNTFSSIAAGSW